MIMYISYVMAVTASTDSFSCVRWTKSIHRSDTCLNFPTQDLFTLEQ